MLTRSGHPERVFAANIGAGSKMRPYVFLTLAPLLWAGNFVFGKPLSGALPPFGINLVRWVLA